MTRIDGSNAYPGYSLSELRARAHSHRTYDSPRWPPRGWTYHGLLHHRATVAREQRNQT